MTMTAIVDAHQHFRNYGTYQTSWMEKPAYAGDLAFAPIQRSFGPADLEPELQAAGVFASVTVQAARIFRYCEISRVRRFPKTNPCYS